MVDRPQINPQSVRRAQGVQVPTLRNVQLPNLRGIGQVQPSAAQAEARSAQITAQVVNDVGNSIMRTAEGIRARAEARRKEEAKRQSEQAKAEQELAKKEGIQASTTTIPEWMVTSEVLDVDSQLSADMQRILSETDDPEEVAARYNARVSGLTSTMPENMAAGVKTFADTRLQGELDKLQASLAEEDISNSKIKTEQALVTALDDGLNNATAQTENQATALEAATVRYFAAVDADPFTSPEERELLKREYLDEIALQGLLNEVSKSQTPLVDAISIAQGNTGDPAVDNLPAELRQQAFRQGLEIKNGLVRLEEQRRAALKEARAEQFFDETRDIRLNPLEPENIKKLQIMREKARTSDELDAIDKLEGIVTGRIDENLDDQSTIRTKALVSAIATRSVSPKRMQQLIADNFEKFTKEDLSKLYNEIGSMQDDLLSSEAYETVLINLDVAFPKAKNVNPLQALISGYDPEAIAGKENETLARDRILSQLREEVRQEKVLDEDQLIERANELVQIQKGSLNQLDETPRSVDDIEPVNRSELGAKTVSSLKKDETFKAIAGRYLVNGTVNKSQIIKDYKSGDISEETFEKLKAFYKEQNGMK